MSQRNSLRATVTSAAIVVAVVLAGAYFLRLVSRNAPLSGPIGNSPGEVTLPSTSEKVKPTVEQPKAPREQAAAQPVEEPPRPDAPAHKLPASKPRGKPSRAPAAAKREPPEPAADSAIEKALAELKAGKLLFNPPAEMRVGTEERVEVRIASSAAEDLMPGLKGRGVPEVEAIKVGRFMTVKLTGTAFDIKALSKEDQFVGTSEFTEWSYLVRPLSPGVHNLDLAVGVRIKLPGGGEETRYYPVLDRAIRVRVNPVFSVARFLSANWQWLASALVFPLLAWWWKRRSAATKPAPDIDV
ncbi:MAG: hypothetical protein EXQ52_10170 [Bryobacterales bacterium]|nr:hypothetical protein [Bryobacterales bacterium]